MDFYCWVTLVGKVFVEKDEIEDRLREKFPQYAEQCKANDDISALSLCTPEEERATFEEIANEQLSEMCRTDTPMKLEDIDLDMSTYRPAK